MGKRKYTSQSRATSSKVARVRVSTLRLPPPVSLSQSTSDNQNAPGNERLPWPPSPPPAHPSYVPPSPRVRKTISISAKVTLSLELQTTEEATPVFEVRVPTFASAAGTPRFDFTSRFASEPQDDPSISFSLLPVFTWATPSDTSVLSDASSDEEVEIESNEEATSSQEAPEEPKESEAVKGDDDDKKTSEISSSDEQNDNHASIQAAEDKGDKENEKEREVDVVKPLHKEPGTEEALEGSEQDAETPSAGASG